MRQILAYIDPVASLRRQTHRLQRRRYVVKVREYTVNNIQLNKIYDRDQMKHGMLMAMTNYFHTDSQFMAALTGKCLNLHDRLYISY